ncbi:MAG: potassium channel family protein [Chloroflexota bacterium]
MTELKDLGRIILMLLLVLAFGTVGYIVIEKWSLIDSIYMTIITITTVGYGEVYPLSNTGKIFSAILIVTGVGVALYAFSNLIGYFVRGHIMNIFGRRRMEDRIKKLNNHFILCGYDKIGQVIANALREEGRTFVILTPVGQEVSQAEERGCLCLQRDPSNYDTLKKAGIERARGLLAVTEDDATNVFIIVSARKLRPDLLIVARASTQDSISKLESVGANRAINPYSTGGERIARIAMYPGVSDFIEKVLPGYGKELSLEDIEVSSNSSLVGKSVKEAQDYSGGASILTIRKHGVKTIAKPSDETKIEVGDSLIILGQREQLKLLERTTEE